MVTFRSIQCHPGLSYIFDFWHSATLVLRAERQSGRMSEIKNVGWTWMTMLTYLPFKGLTVAESELWSILCMSIFLRHGCKQHDKELIKWYPRGHKLCVVLSTLRQYNWNLLTVDSAAFWSWGEGAVLGAAAAWSHLSDGSCCNCRHSVGWIGCQPCRSLLRLSHRRFAVRWDWNRASMCF